jgi:phage gpG-like protein
MKLDVTVKDCSAELDRNLDAQFAAALREIGGKSVKRAQNELERAKRVDTGALRDSIGYDIDGNTVYIGTNNEYAPHHELGTGRFTRPHASEKYGVSAVHFLRNAFAKHMREINRILADAAKKGGR